MPRGPSRTQVEVEVEVRHLSEHTCVEDKGACWNQVIHGPVDKPACWNQVSHGPVSDTDPNLQPECTDPGGWLNIKMSSNQYRKTHCGDKTILRPSYLHNGISYTGKMISLYWIRALVLTLDTDTHHTATMYTVHYYTLASLLTH